MRGARRRRLALAALALLVAAGLAACSLGNAKKTTLPTATTGSVQVAVDHTAYTISQAIGVTVSNSAGKTDYYAITGKSVCTYFQLEEYNASKNVWVPVDGCQTSDQPHVLLIPHASNIPYTLAPQSAVNQNQWQPGTYRIALDYSSNSTASSNIQTAYSAGFTITAS